jgi:hypothetical protein
MRKHVSDESSTSDGQRGILLQCLRLEVSTKVSLRSPLSVVPRNS